MSKLPLRLETHYCDRNGNTLSLYFVAGLPPAWNVRNGINGTKTFMAQHFVVPKSQYNEADKETHKEEGVRDSSKVSTQKNYHLALVLCTCGSNKASPWGPRCSPHGPIPSKIREPQPQTNLPPWTPPLPATAVQPTIPIPHNPSAPFLIDPILLQDKAPSPASRHRSSRSRGRQGVARPEATTAALPADATPHPPPHLHLQRAVQAEELPAYCLCKQQHLPNSSFETPHCAGAQRDMRSARSNAKAPILNATPLKTSAPAEAGSCLPSQQARLPRKERVCGCAWRDENTLWNTAQQYHR